MPVKPHRPKGPPLTALRAFEASARLGGFVQAAEELSVTPGAISQHIKALEAWAGAPLFERRVHGVHLTQFGARLAPMFTEAFDTLGDAVQSLRALPENKRFHIAALPSVAQLWLPSRLSKLREQDPDATFSVTALEMRPNLKREVFDLLLFIDVPENVEGATCIAEDVITPVCAPEVAARLNSAEHLLHETLLVDTSWDTDWADWAAVAQVDLPNLQTASCHSLYALAVDEARNGAGVLMGHTCLLQAALEDGSLVAPFDMCVKTGKALMLSSTNRARQLAARLRCDTG